MAGLFGGGSPAPPPPPPPPKPPNQLGAKQLQYAALRQREYPLGGLRSLVTNTSGARGITGIPRLTNSTFLGQR
jgi:hypothetical protein